MSHGEGMISDEQYQKENSNQQDASQPGPPIDYHGRSYAARFLKERHTYLLLLGPYAIEKEATELDTPIPACYS